MAERLRHIFTSESVTEGHPDKMADQISDAVLDAVMTDDPTGRVACEVLVTTGICVVSGEITTKTYVDVPKLARAVIHDIGYTDAEMGFDCEDLRRSEHDPEPVAGHRDGRGYRRRGRSGPDVRLRLRRNAGADAAADHAGAQAVPPAERSPARRQAELSASGRQEPGQRRVRGRQADAHRRGGGFDPARRRCLDRDAARRSEEAHHRSGCCRRTWSIRRPSITSIPPDVSSSADRTATPG